MTNPKVLLTTNLGEIELEIFITEAPVTATNFLRYVDEHRYVGAAFYRTVRLDNQPQSTVKIEVIQGGLGMDAHPSKLPVIPHETTEQTGLRHLEGTVSMSRFEPGSASSEIFICINDQPTLDFGGARNPDGQGFAAFGRVTRGMEVVREIQSLPSGGNQAPVQGQWLLEPVKITSVSRLP
jgi:peptidyl-prolyl cis-trans isomerase A (cyclophilin A)